MHDNYRYIVPFERGPVSSLNQKLVLRTMRELKRVN
jgi:hypothetical protein